MRTSVNLRVLDLPKLRKGSKSSVNGCSRLINLCLRKLFTSHPDILNMSRAERLVEYQPKGVGYEIIGIVFDFDVYNLGINFRVFSRVSVSMMVTIAIDKYLDEVLYEINSGTKVIHNYERCFHLKRHNRASNRSTWGVIWQVEKKKEMKRIST